MAEPALAGRLCQPVGIEPRPSDADTATPRRSRGRPPRSTDERASHRRRLVESAMESIRRSGPDLSMEQIADRAEVSKPVFYSEFGDKNGLVDAMAVVLAEGVEQTVVDRLQALGVFDADHMVGAIIEALVDLIDEEPQLYAYIVRSLRMRDRGLLDNALARVVRDRAAFVMGTVTGDLGDDDVDLLAAGVFGFVMGVVERWMETRRPAKEVLVDTVSAVIMTGLTETARRRRLP